MNIELPRKGDMLKKYTLLLLIISLFLINPAVQAQPFTGFYLGGAAGAKQLDVNSSTDFVYGPNSTTFVFYLQHPGTVNDTSYSGEIQLGYGYSWLRHRIHLGGDIFANFSNNNVTSTARLRSPAVGVNFDMRTNLAVKLRPVVYGFDFTPGFLLTKNSLLYAIVGYVRGNAEVTTFGEVQQAGGGRSGTFSFNDNKNLSGYRLGIGLSQLINSYLALRMYYVHSDFHKKSISATSATVEGAPINSASTLKLSTNSVFLGIAYYFSRQRAYQLPTIIEAGNSFNGFYIGGRFGLSQFHIPTNSFFDLFSVPFGSNIISSNSRGISGKIRGSFILGVSHLIKKFYIGVEAFLGITPNNKNTWSVSFDETNVAFPVNQKITTKLNSFEYGLDATPGLQVSSNILLFLRAGIAFNYARLLVNNFGFDGFAPETITQNLVKKQHLFGLRLGIGAKVLVASHTALALNYIYTNYGAISVRGDTIGTLDFGFSKTIQKIKTNAFLVGITHYFK